MSQSQRQSTDRSTDSGAGQSSESVEASYGRTDGLTEISLTSQPQPATSVPRARVQPIEASEGQRRRSAPASDASTASSRCLHEMDPQTCSWCSGRDGGETAEKARHLDLLLNHRCVEAAWSSTCAGCGERYAAGTPIKRAGYGWNAPCCIDDDGRPT